MKIIVVGFILALAALAIALPTANTASFDIFKNTLVPLGSRVIGGKDAKRLQFPYQASIQEYFLGKYRHNCGGTLISTTRVLTAAHCKPFTVSFTRVLFGLLVQDENHPDVQVRGVERFVSHPKYPGGNIVAANDIAVIILSEPVTLTPAVQIATLGSEEDCKAVEPAVLSGWGAVQTYPHEYPAVLQYAELPRLSNEQCKRDLVKVFGTVGAFDDTQLCTTANPGPHQSACSGDSGGPLVRLASNKLVGVVSWGAKVCETKGAPSVFTNVCSHLEFINSQ